jgi:hypothetical protein
VRLARCRTAGIVIHSLSTSVALSGSDFPISAKGTIVVSLGPLTVTIEGFGIEQPLRLTTDGTGNLGVLDLQRPRFAMPTGIGVEIDASVVKGGGFLRVTDTQIAGALELSLVLGSLTLSIQAFGVIQQINGELSFMWSCRWRSPMTRSPRPHAECRRRLAPPHGRLSGPA